RRMLLTGKAFTEGARARALWTGLQADLKHRHPDEEVRTAADDVLQLMTPVIKAYYTDMGVEVASDAVQVYGGHGYIKEHGMEQFLRDARIAPIYEGTNGIQALDLVGRKLAMNGGRAVQTFFKDVESFIKDSEGDENIAPQIKQLSNALQQLQSATMWLMQNGMQNPDNAGAVSTDYLRLLALVAMAWKWAEMMKVCHELIAAGEGHKEALEAKLITGRFFFDKMLPETNMLIARVETGSESMMALDAAAF
ncbi:MAG: acyl-CoA dehydrogenase C-terminal domain-containing protein, partial [Alphaproteobacteria bacterium]|nr:acyl-CoA dehydrogenase C-terminal domain-containing protein [Alphaproteobacteria bacterium]